MNENKSEIILRFFDDVNTICETSAGCESCILGENGRCSIKLFDMSEKTIKAVDEWIAANHIHLDPCPFCGQTESVRFHYFENEDGTKDFYNIQVQCNHLEGGCGAASGYARNKVDAARNWNKRESEKKPEPKKETVSVKYEYTKTDEPEPEKVRVWTATDQCGDYKYTDIIDYDYCNLCEHFYSNCWEERNECHKLDRVKGDKSCFSKDPRWGYH